MAFIVLRYVLSVHSVLSVLSGEFFFFFSPIINKCRISSKGFSASIEMIIGVLSFNLLMLSITYSDLPILKNPLIPGINP